MVDTIHSLLRSGLPISLSDVVAIKQLTMADVDAWVTGAIKAEEIRRGYYGDIQATIYNAVRGTNATRNDVYSPVQREPMTEEEMIAKLRRGLGI